LTDHILMFVEESIQHVMLWDDWLKYGRTRQSAKQPKWRCMKRCCWAFCVTTQRPGHVRMGNCRLPNIIALYGRVERTELEEDLGSAG